MLRGGEEEGGSSLNVWGVCGAYGIPREVEKGSRALAVWLEVTTGLYNFAERVTSDS